MGQEFILNCSVVFHPMDTQFVYPFSRDGNLSCCQFSGITTKGAMGILVPFVLSACFSFSWVKTQE